MKQKQKLATILKQIEAQQKTLSQSIKNTAKTKVAAKITKNIPASVYNKSSLIFTLIFNLFNVVFKHWLQRLNKFWRFKFLFSLINFLIWPISKIIALFSYYKLVRTCLLLLAFIFGLNLDLSFNYINISYASITALIWGLLDKIMDLLIKILTNFAQWLYRIQVGRIPNLREPEIELKPINEIKHFDQKVEFDNYFQEKQYHKNKLFEALNIKEEQDTTWFSKKVLIGLAVGVTLAACAGIYYIYYYDRNPLPTISQSELDAMELKELAAQRTLENEAGPSNYIQDASTNAWDQQRGNSPSNALSIDDRAFKDAVFPYQHEDATAPWTKSSETINNPSSPASSTSSLETVKPEQSPKLGNTVNFSGDDDSNFIAWGNSWLNRKK